MILALGAKGLKFDSRNAPSKENKHNFETSINFSYIYAGKYIGIWSTIKAFGLSGMIMM